MEHMTQNRNKSDSLLKLMEKWILKYHLSVQILSLTILLFSKKKYQDTYRWKIKV